MRKTSGVVQGLTGSGLHSRQSYIDTGVTKPTPGLERCDFGGYMIKKDVAMVDSIMLIRLPGTLDSAWVVGAEDDAEGLVFTC